MPASPTAERPIFAVIPSTELLQIVLDGDALPSEVWHEGQGTFEDTLVDIGQRVVGQAVSADWAYHQPGGTIYLVKPLQPAETSFGPRARWQGMPLGGETSRLMLRQYWQQFIIDASRSILPHRR